MSLGMFITIPCRVFVDTPHMDGKDYTHRHRRGARVARFDKWGNARAFLW